jgi:hypothetical protein
MSRLPPIPKTFTAIIAERKFVLRSGNKERHVRLQIGMPTRDVPTVSGLDWRCPFRLLGPSRRRRLLQGYGVDSLQSLIHALSLIEYELAAVEQQHHEPLLWLEELSHGFPEIQLASSLQPSVA